MTRRILFYILFYALATVGIEFAHAQDTVLLNNGDTLTGTILEQNADSVYFDSRTFGPVTLKAIDIREIRFGTDESGGLAASADAVAVESVKPATLDPSRFVGPLPASPEAKKSQWTGQAGVSIAMRESTQSDVNGVTGSHEGSG